MDGRVVGAWERIERWLQANAEPVHANLAPGASDGDLAALVAAIGCDLPSEVVASLKRHDGLRDEYPGLIGGWELLSCRRIAQEWEIWKGLLDNGELEGPSSPADPRIKTDWWNPRWIPVTSSGSGNHHCVDLDPVGEGHAGQVIVLWHDDETRPLVALTYAEWLEQIAAGLESGALQAFEEEGDWVLEPSGFLLE
jgi:cell wall assembly regulator SMI1